MVKRGKERKNSDIYLQWFVIFLLIAGFFLMIYHYSYAPNSKWVMSISAAAQFLAILIIVIKSIKHKAFSQASYVPGSPQPGV